MGTGGRGKSTLCAWKESSRTQPSTREFLRDIKAKKTARTGKYRVSCVRRHEARVFKHFATFVLQSVREKKQTLVGCCFIVYSKRYVVDSNMDMEHNSRHFL